MEDNDINDVDSLFEGMDFVMPIPSPRQLTESTEEHGADSGAELFTGEVEPSSPSSGVYLQRSSSALSTAGAFLNTLSEPLDESLFCGLDLSGADSTSNKVPMAGTVHAVPPVSSEDIASMSNTDFVATDAAVQSPSSKVKGEDKKLKQGSMEKSSFESIMAAYSDPAVGRANHPGGQLSRPTNIRRKKRSMKIGYGREAGEYEDAHSKASERTKLACTEDTFASREGLGASSEGSQTTTEALTKEDNILARTSQVMGEAAKDLNTKAIIQSMSQRGSSNQVTLEDVGGETNTVELSLSPTGRNPLAKGVGSTPFLLDSAKYQVVGDTKLEKETPADTEIVLETGIKSAAANMTVTELESLAEGVHGGQLPDKGDAQVFLKGVFENIKNSVAMKLKALDERRTSASSKRKAAVRKKRLMVEKVSAATAKLREVEAELESACEREDFERAYVLSEEAKEAEVELEAASIAFTDAEAGCDFATEELQNVWDLHLAIEEEGIYLFRSLKQEAEEESRRVEETVAQEVRIKTERLTVEEEVFELKQSKATTELRVIEESRQELRTCIEDSTADEIREKTGLKDKQDQLNAELQLLLLMVKDKEAEIAENNAKIAQVDNKIAGKAGKFEMQKEQLAVESQAVTDILHALEKESEHLAAQKTVIESLLSYGLEKMSTLLHIATMTSNEATSMQQVVDVRRAAAKVRLLLRRKEVDLAEKESHALQDCQSLRKEASAARTAIQELSGHKEKYQQEMAAAKQKIHFVEKRGPELDSEKRLAASSRNFKEAARLAAEAKSLVVEKEAAATTLSRIVKVLEKLEEEAEDCTKRLADIECLLAANEKQSSMARCERLRLLAAAARDERDAAAELEDFSEAESLDAEAEVLDVEAEELRKTFQLEGPQFDKLFSLHLSDGCSTLENFAGKACDEAAHSECASLEVDKVE